MSFKRINITKSDNIVIDYFFNSAPSKVLIISFTERTNRDLDGYGFGGNFLSNRGIDFISIKSSTDSWYSNLTSEVLSTVCAFVIRIKSSYERVITYGSSMGGYAAMKYAKALQANRVIAISPIYSILFDWEDRWNDDIERFNINEMSLKEDFSSQIEYVTLFDSFDKDSNHALLFKENIRENCKLIKYPFSGHPCSYFLAEVGLLKTLVTDLINFENIDSVTTHVPIRERRLSESYLFWFGQYLIERRSKAKSAKVCNDILISRNPLNAEYYMQRGKIFYNLGDHKSAIKFCDKATELNPSNPHYSLYKQLIIKNASHDLD